MQITVDQPRSMLDIYKLYENMEDNNIMLSFKGEVSFGLINSVLGIIEDKLEVIEGSRKTKKKFYNVLVECLQNLGHHVEGVEDEGPFGKSVLLMIWSESDDYRVATGNYIENDRIPKLQGWLEHINSLDKEALRELYRETMKGDGFSDKGGAGLGFLDIARKSGQKLNFGFKPVDDKSSFFSFQISIPKNGE